MTDEENKQTCSCCCCGCSCCNAEPDQIATFLRGVADALEDAFGE